MAAKKGLDAQAVYDKFIELNRHQRNTASFFGVDPNAISLHVRRIEGAARVEKTQEAEIVGLKQQVRLLERRILTDARVETEILKLAKAPTSPPEWLTRKPKTGSFHAGVPTFFASDWHYGEVVRAAEIGGLNEYNSKIADARAEIFINQGVSLLKDHMPRSTYDGAVLMLGGDMVSGDIHDELAQTNEFESMPAILKLNGIIGVMVERLADEFGKVFVPCVTGNHGRTSRKPRHKRRNHTNFDWLLYNLLAMHFAKDKRVTFQIPEGPDAFFRVYATRYLLTHGDQFRGGDGMIGAIGPITRGDKRKRSRNAETDASYDVICMGHWHQYIHNQQLIVNGSLKGYDEYAYANNFGYEPAIQALWVTHPDHGLTFRMPVFVQRKPKGGDLPWVSVK